MPSPEKLYSGYKEAADGIEASQSKLEGLYAKDAQITVDRLKETDRIMDAGESLGLRRELLHSHSEQSENDAEINRELKNFDKQQRSKADHITFGQYASEKDKDFYQQQAMNEAIAAGKKIVAPESGIFESASDVSVLPPESEAKPTK